MGFLSGIVGGLLGGSKKGAGASSSQSGYSALPPELQGAFNPLGVGIGKYTNPDNPGVTAMFTPTGQTKDETRAFARMRNGFTPTAKSLKSDLSMLMNPYDDYVINDINRQAQGDFSILKQNMNQAGQFGSNRQQLGANDIDLTRTNQIGNFRQSQYNNALDQIFNELIPQRQQDTQNLLGIGNFQRGIKDAGKMAPINALQAGTGMLGPFVSGGTGQTMGKGAFDTILGGVGALLPAAAGAYAASDIRLKENIELMGEQNGFPIYKFNYNGDKRTFVGVMAQDVIRTNPEAVIENDQGYLMVNYEAIGVDFVEVK